MARLCYYYRLLYGSVDTFCNSSFLDHTVVLDPFPGTWSGFCSWRCGRWSCAPHVQTYSSVFYSLNHENNPAQWGSNPGPSSRQPIFYQLHYVCATRRSNPTQVVRVTSRASICQDKRWGLVISFSGPYSVNTSPLLKLPNRTFKLLSFIWVKKLTNFKYIYIYICHWAL